MKPTISRRTALSWLGPLLAARPALIPSPARAIVNGKPVTDAEAAVNGVVGLYIDLSGCTICRVGKGGGAVLG